LTSDVISDILAQMNREHDNPNENDEFYANSSLISVCCGAPQMGDSDLCADCGEHTSFEEVRDE
jgi:hypothetical protein